MFCDKLDEVMRHFSKTGAFLTVKDGERVNTMTVSWGFIGFIWNKPHFICVVRPQRHTFGIIERAASFTVSVPFGDMAAELEECGTKSGRDFDKSKIVEFIPAKAVESPVVAGCARYFECVIEYRDILKEIYLPAALRDSWYQGDYHHFYIGEIMEAY
jgi:flavin reductase (DIM6/NTAB) family NADH-FMN oxidoreductase RutF